MAKILVVIPCYNMVKYVRETIASVKAQDYDDWECVIVDDGSYDGTESYVETETAGDARFKVIHTENRGVASARNLGIEKGEGEYVICLDADDRLLPGALGRFVRTWEKNPDASLVVPRIVRFGDNRPPVVQERKWQGYEDLKVSCSPTNTSCFRKSDWQRVGGYRDGTMYEDWEFWLRLLYHNDRVVNIRDILVEYRIHPDSRWHNAVKFHERELGILRELNPEIFGQTTDQKTAKRPIVTEDDILVVIPFLAGDAQGDELSLAVAGWRKHFKEPYHIVVVGDYHHVVETGEDISFIECPRVDAIPGQYRPHIDHVHKFRRVREEFPDSKGFIYTCDDIYGTADFTMADILQPKEPRAGFGFAPFDWRKETAWYADKGKTGELCDREGLPRRNWVCHLPVYYEWDKLFSIYDKYDCDHVSYIVENIYFNIEYPGDPHAVSEELYHDEVKTAYPAIRPIGTVKWISNANSGWSRELAVILKKHYKK